MPRDGSGVYTLPAGNPVVTNTVVASVWANTTMSDIAAQLNNVLTRDGLLGPTGPFKIVDGTVNAPGLAFNSEPGLGFYRNGASVLGLAAQGGLAVGTYLASAATTAVVLYPRATGSSNLQLRTDSALAVNYATLNMYCGPGAGATIQTLGQGSVTRGNLTIDAPVASFTNSVIAAGYLQAPAIVGGSASVELSIYPASPIAAYPPWPTTNGGLITVRGSSSANFGAAGAISCYSGSGNTGMALLNGATAWSLTSDERLKNIDSEVTDGLAAVLAMRPIRYRYKFEDASAPLRVGLTAQSVQAYVPEAVDEVLMLGDDGKATEEMRLSLRITEVIPHMIDAIKTLNERLAQLENA
jgi:Chaperone of endosialidase